MWRRSNTMANIKVISKSTIHAAATQNDDPILEMQLTPWDLQLLLVDPIQKGLLYHNNPTPNLSSPTIIQHLKDSLSSTLTFFSPLAGRLAVTEHDGNTSTVSILCNNSGALFVHAVADNCSVEDILCPRYTPTFVHSFFPLNRVRNYQGTSKPLLAVQVTELADAIFIGCAMNHVVGDGTSFWHFMNSWAEISRGLDRLSKPPALERWFLDGVNGPGSIRIPFTKEKIMHCCYDGFVSELQRERVFHFTKEKIERLKAKANAEVGGDESSNNNKKISSLQALLTHLWRSIVRNQGLDPQEEVNYRLLIGARGRMKSPILPQNYFGNAVQDGTVTMKVCELLEGGLRKAALEMNKMVSLHTEESLKSHYRSWVKNPRLLTEGGMAGNALVTSSSPRFDVYGNDFGWGKPVAVRSGLGNKSHGKITVFAGVEDGSIDIEVCLSYEILEAMGNDPEFMDAVST